jgi:hypothetical protein
MRVPTMALVNGIVKQGAQNVHIACISGKLRTSCSDGFSKIPRPCITIKTTNRLRRERDRKVRVVRMNSKD